MEYDLYLISNEFWHKRKMYNFNPYNVLLAIAHKYTPATCQVTNVKKIIFTSQNRQYGV